MTSPSQKILIVQQLGVLTGLPESVEAEVEVELNHLFAFMVNKKVSISLCNKKQQMDPDSGSKLQDPAQSRKPAENCRKRFSDHLNVCSVVPYLKPLFISFSFKVSNNAFVKMVSPSSSHCWEGVHTCSMLQQNLDLWVPQNITKANLLTFTNWSCINCVVLVATLRDKFQLWNLLDEESWFECGVF